MTTEQIACTQERIETRRKELHDVFSKIEGNGRARVAMGEGYEFIFAQLAVAVCRLEVHALELERTLESREKWEKFSVDFVFDEQAALETMEKEFQSVDNLFSRLYELIGGLIND
ncbi:hypothetical protein C5B42_03550 [Candidatus Cerribacteria bacterium 'Amazon FNV 2010 28 9']|uniref:Uncharacterized protein n=1 Tax=Candidatus Cerribacteria bacterium 'Amazon FNV 2010 28 9' TaxID=2081795 RepID=A0A317JPI4_9BACT|nr:MAG: hypothetical protein C5B42_03550 [Candidatus Cerribacteria bacterium 'Amazon FNV 2010 28 9']